MLTREELAEMGTTEKELKDELEREMRSYQGRIYRSAFCSKSKLLLIVILFHTFMGGEMTEESLSRETRLSKPVVSRYLEMLKTAEVISFVDSRTPIKINWDKFPRFKDDDQDQHDGD